MSTISAETIKSVLSEYTINELLDWRSEIVEDLKYAEKALKAKLPYGSQGHHDMCHEELEYNAVSNSLANFNISDEGKVLEWWVNGQNDPILMDENGLHIPVFPDILITPTKGSDHDSA